MNTERYVVLRVDRPITLDGPGPRTAGSSPRFLGSDFESPSVTVESGDMTPNEYLDLARDRSVLAATRPFPTKLIAPIPSAAAVATPAGPTWGVQEVGAVTSTFTGAGVKVAVLDTGIDRTHPAFAGITIHEQDFSGSGNGDRQGHGTHCAGTIFGRDVAGTRIGVARGVTQAYIAKVLKNDGSGNTEMLFRGILGAFQNNAQVLSMSLGFDFPGYVDDLVNRKNYPVNLATSNALKDFLATARALDALMQYAQTQIALSNGCVVIAASGNESQLPNVPISASLPAAAEGVISVGAMAKNGANLLIAPFSNTHPQVVAPGVNVVSAKTGGGLIASNGTSMACPHVAGVAALYWEAIRAAGIMPNSANVIRQLITGCDRTRLSGYSQNLHGFGFVRAP